MTSQSFSLPFPVPMDACFCVPGIPILFDFKICLFNILFNIFLPLLSLDTKFFRLKRRVESICYCEFP